MHESLSERAAADDGAAVIVLNGSGENLRGRGRAFVDENHEGYLLVAAPAVALVLMAWRLAALGIDDELIGGQEFVDDLRPVAKEIRVYEITGPLFFGVSDMLANDIDVKHFTKVLVIRMRSVPAIDVTALRALRDLVERAKAKGVTVVFSHVNEQPRHMMEKADFISVVGEENFAPNIDAALDRAETIIGK